MGFLSSINTGLQNIPDLTDIQSVGKLSFQFIQIYNAIQILQQAIDSYTGNSPVDASTSDAAPESTILVGNTANMYATAGEDIDAGYLVYIYNNAGVQSVKKSTASDLSKIAMGLSMGSATTGNQIQILLLGLFNFGASAVTPGTIYYSNPGGVAGSIAAAPPETAGALIQPVGFAVDTSSIFFNFCLNPQAYVAPSD